MVGGVCDWWDEDAKPQEADGKGAVLTNLRTMNFVSFVFQLCDWCPAPLRTN